MVTRCDKRIEKKWDKAVRSQWSTEVIQNHWRGFQARKTARHLRELNASILINKNAKVFLAKLLTHRMRQQNAAVRLQKQVRVKLARLELGRLRAAHTLKLKNLCALKMQARFKGNKAR